MFFVFGLFCLFLFFAVAEDTPSVTANFALDGAQKSSSNPFRSENGGGVAPEKKKKNFFGFGNPFRSKRGPPPQQGPKPKNPEEDLSAVQEVRFLAFSCSFSFVPKKLKKAFKDGKKKVSIEEIINDDGVTVDESRPIQSMNSI